MKGDEIRIVSLAPSITRELVDLGLKDHIVGATSYCDISADNKDLIVGSAITVNIERVLLLKPDMVFASGLTKDKTIHTLKENGVTVYKFGKMTSFDYTCENFIELAKYVNKENVARSIIKKSKEKIDSLIASVPKRIDSLSIFFQVGSKPIFTVIPNTFMNDYITFAGCKNIASDLTKPSINRETVINRNPDIIFIISMGIEGDKEKSIWESYPDLNAAKNKKIFIIDAYKAASPTVKSFTESFEIIMNAIYY
jgi:iron complex transport system substrate-binding protein